MDNEWDEYADGWDDDPAARAYAAAAFSSLTDLLRPWGRSLDGALVLDFGCGTGLLTEQLVDAGARVAAVDTSQAMLDVLDAKIRTRGWTTVTTHTRLPEPSASMSLVVCSSVCSFLDDYPAAVVDLASRLEPGGVFAQWDWERSGDDEHGLSRAEISEALLGAGLTDVDVVTAFDVDMHGQSMAPLLGSGRWPGP